MQKYSKNISVLVIIVLVLGAVTPVAYAQTTDAALLQQLRHGEPTETITRTDINGTPPEGSIFFDAATKFVYIYKDNNWTQLLDGNSGWTLNGNSGINATTDFLGTTDNNDLVLRANNQERLRLAQERTQVQLNRANDFNNHPLVIRASGNDILAFQDAAGNPDWHWNLIGNGLNFVESNVADFRMYLEDGGNVGLNTSNPEATLDINPVSNEVPLRIRPNGTTPTGLSRGEFYVDNTDGLLYTYDSTRNKWLSVDRNLIGWGRNANNATNEYLRQFNGALSSDNGWRMIRNGTITAITVQCDVADTFTIEIRKNDATAVIASLTVTAAEGAHVTTTNVNFDEGDFLQCFLNGTNIEYPEVLIETAWRK